MKTFLRSIGAIFGLVAFVGLVIIAWGTGLPLDHSATCSATFGASSREVWNAVADVVHSPQWRTDIVHAALMPSANGHTRFEETDRYGRAHIFDEAPRGRGAVIQRSLVVEPDAPFSGSWTYRVTPTSGGAVLSIAENGRIFNPAFRFLARYALGYTATMHQYLVDLGKRFGEAPQIQCATLSPR